MIQSNMRRVKHIHFVGIGGSGMAGIAEILLREGYTVSGSDLSKNAATALLKKLNATIYQGHDESYLKNADVVVKSAAISEHNPEIKAAHQHRIPVISRAEMLAELMRFRYGIAIAGTHGKTTTTSLLASIFSEGQLDPTFVIGGRLNSVGSNAQLGRGKYLIAEADESDASFLHLLPMISVITNIDADHLETYNGEFNLLLKTFLHFIHRLPFYGLAVVCIDDPVIRSIITDIARPLLTYGFSEEADVRAVKCESDGLQQRFTVIAAKTHQQFDVTIAMPGQHNILNALACIGVALELGIDIPVIQKAFAKFEGVERRFNVYDACTLHSKKFTVVDDYGHHPKELAVTFDAAKQAWPGRRIVWVFQPHRYTRTRDLFHDFCDVLVKADELILLDVYPAGEELIPGADGAALFEAIKTRKQNAVFAGDFTQAAAMLHHAIKDHDIVLMQGAGNIKQFIETVVQGE
jgi:UDP-N-acetylmuramate--alanine ligase